MSCMPDMTPTSLVAPRTGKIIKNRIFERGDGQIADFSERGMALKGLR